MNKRYSVMEPQPMSFRQSRRSGRRYVSAFRTAKDDIDCVRLITGNVGYDMEKGSSWGLFDYYAISWKLGEEPFSYCFQVEKVKSFAIMADAAYRRNGKAFMISGLFRDFLRRSGQKVRLCIRFYRSLL